jgi:hypothetical protein
MPELLGLAIDLFLLKIELLLRCMDFHILSRRLLLHFVEQHRGEFIIAHALDLARPIADHELRIHFVDFLGDPESTVPEEPWGPAGP